MTATIVDVSNVNGSIDFRAVKRAGISCAFLKASEGLTWNDPMFKGFRSACYSAGVRPGAYHFARPDLHPYDPEGEADHLCSVVKKLGRVDLKPVLDLEVSSKGKLSPAGMVDWSRRFNRRVKLRLGVFPIFYSYSAFIHDLGATSPIGNGLWLAAYGRNDGHEYPAVPPPPWEKIVAHQFTSRGRLAGHDGYVDLSHAAKLNPLLAHPVIGL